LSKSVYLYGIHSVDQLLKSQAHAVVRLHLDKSRGDKRINEIVESAQALDLPIEWHNRQTLDSMAEFQQHQGCVAECRLVKPGAERELDDCLQQAFSEQAQRDPLFLLLDQVQDPHNLGACLRSAEAAGVSAVIAPRDNSAPLNATVFKSSAGAALRVPFFQVTNLVRTQQQLKQQGVWLVGTAANAEKTLYQLNLSGPLGLVLGSEGKGMRRLVQENCDYLASIPMFGHVSSLNVSVSTGICLYEALRQRGFLTR